MYVIEVYNEALDGPTVVDNLNGQTQSQNDYYKNFHSSHSQFKKKSKVQSISDKGRNAEEHAKFKPT